MLHKHACFDAVVATLVPQLISRRLPLPQPQAALSAVCLPLPPMAVGTRCTHLRPLLLHTPLR